MGILSELYSRLLGTTCGICHSRNDTGKDACRSGHSEGQSEDTIRIMELEKKVKSLETIAHAPRAFVTCENCKQTIKEK